MTFNLNKISRKIAAWVAVLAIVLPMNISSVTALAATDTTPPTVKITSPVAGVMDGSIKVTGTVQDDVGLSHYNLSLYNGSKTVDLSDGQNHSGSRIIPVPGASGDWGTQNNVSGSALTTMNVSATATLPNGNYQIRLAAKDAAGNEDRTINGTSSSVQVVAFTVDNDAPTTAITSPANGATVNGTVLISGSASDTNLKNSTFTITGPNSYSYTNTSDQEVNSFDWNAAGLTNGQYQIQYTATDQAGNSSAPKTIAVMISNSISAPANFTATPGDQQVDLNWDGVPTADHYRVSFDDVTKNPTTPVYAYIVTTDNGTHLNISQLANGHNYAFGIKAIDKFGNESASWATTNATPDAISAPANFVATPGNGKVNLTWDGVPTAAHYKVSFNDATENPGTPVNAYINMADLSTNLEITGLANGHVYNFGIQATDAFGEQSSWTNTSATPHVPVVALASTNNSVASSPSSSVATSSTFKDSSNTGKQNASKVDKNKSTDKNESIDKTKEDTSDKASDKNGKIKGEETKNDTASDKAVLTFIILLLALAAGIGGYYAYEWWLTKQDEELVTPMEEKKGKPADRPNNNNRNRSNSKNKKKNGRW